MTANNQNNAHHCDALVIHCIDFRFHEAIKNFLQNELGIKSYDLLTIPGAAKHLTAAGSAARRDGLLEDIGISIRLHEPKEIILIKGNRVTIAIADRAYPADVGEGIKEALKF